MNTIYIKFPCSLSQLEQIQRNPESLLNFLAMEPLKADIFDALKDKDGAPTVSNMKISQYNFDFLIGTFRLNFQVDRQFCCADTSACATDYIDFKYHYHGEQFFAKGEFLNWVLDN